MSALNLKVQSIALMLIGAGMAALSLLADLLGIGANQNVIGWKQFFGASVGIMLILFGLHLVLHHMTVNE